MKRLDQKPVIFRLPPDIHKALLIKLMQNDLTVQKFFEQKALDYLNRKGQE